MYPIGKKLVNAEITLQFKPIAKIGRGNGCGGHRYAVNFYRTSVRRRDGTWF